MSLLAALQVFCSTAKVGLIGFGGGNTMISLLEREVVTERAWMTAERYREVLAYSFTVPGLSAGKIAAWVGWEQAGLLGMLLGLIGIWLPGMLMMFGLIYLLRGYQETWWYPKVLRGILFASAGMIIASVFSALPKGQLAVTQGRFLIGLLIASAVFYVVWKLESIPPVLAVLAAGLLGLLVF